MFFYEITKHLLKIKQQTSNLKIKLEKNKNQKNLHQTPKILGLCKTGVHQSSLKKADAKLLRYMDGHE